jgi:DNA mismatch repair protein MutS
MAKTTTTPSQTPMMRQYHALKAQVAGARLLFRMGDFYELFLEDAEVVAPLLDLVLTTRDKEAAHPIPMCGVPVHAIEGYIRRLLEAGERVAIAEQVEDPKTAKGLVRREIVEVISPGLVANADRLGTAAANYIAAVCAESDALGLAYLDVSTGELSATATPSRATLAAELARIAPRELLAPETDKALCDALGARPTPDAHFEVAAGLARLERAPASFAPAPGRAGDAAAGLSLHDAALAARAAAALLATVAEQQPAALSAVDALRLYRAADHMVLDPATRRHLELSRNARDGREDGTLLEVLDHTRTPMGRRMLVARLGEPLVDIEAIEARQAEIAQWLEADHARRLLRDALRGVGDLERLATRVALAGVAPRDLVSLRASLAGLRDVHAHHALPDAMLGPLTWLHDTLARTLVDDPPAPPRGEPHTGYVRDGVDAEVDRVRAESAEGDAYLAALEAREREQTGIRGLRVRYNRVFGYSIEVGKAHASRVPETYRRKQTTANAERYTTEELLHWEGVVLRARETAARAEASVLERLRAAAVARGPALRAAARCIAALDCAQSLAEAARRNDYVRPTLCAQPTLDIEAGRHPVAERYTTGGFVPNDVHLDRDGAALIILTGPNMAGKSTLLRQVALIALMAQMGAWVPARSARVGIVDRIFTRVGASDSLTTGESTFMVEMRETADILRDATPKSLVVLDEIGRGTSTFDGLSIAWSVAEHLHDTPSLRPRTLFATHYHELADLARTRPGVRNFHFACREVTGPIAGDTDGRASSHGASSHGASSHGRDARPGGGDIVFLRRMEPGAASRSYGIEVARHAGLPAAVIRRARAILANLERGELDERGRPRLAREHEPLTDGGSMGGGSEPDAALRQMPEGVRNAAACAGDGLVKDTHAAAAAACHPPPAQLALFSPPAGVEGRSGRRRGLRGAPELPPASAGAPPRGTVGVGAGEHAGAGSEGGPSAATRAERLREALLRLDPEQMTPIEALVALVDLVGEARRS